MNEDEMQALEPLAGEALERQLARYARVRLDPTPAQSRRARTAIMEAAWRRRLEPANVVPLRRSRRGLFASWTARRLGASMAAAVLAGLLVGSATFAATRAGAPLYDARLTFEALTLPADPEARLEAELAQAQTRLAELVEAAGRGDQGAVQAALAGYGRSLDDLAATTGGPASRALEAVEFHRAVLLHLMDTVPEQALPGLENALARSSGVIDKLGAAGGGSPGAGGASGAGSGGNGGSGGNAGSGGSDPGNKPDRTPGPARTPAPDPTPKPPKSPNPNAAKTPAPAATADAGDQGQP
jgi:hypothetical protein